MKKLDAYKQVAIDLDFAKLIIGQVTELIQKVDFITVNTTTITNNSSDKQFVYVIGILNSQITACNELGIDPIEYADCKARVLAFRLLVKELADWVTYQRELFDYKQAITNLLTDKERFALLTYPVKE